MGRQGDKDFHPSGGKRGVERVKKRFSFLPHALLCEHMHKSIESFQKMGRPPVAGLLQFPVDICCPRALTNLLQGTSCLC